MIRDFALPDLGEGLTESEVVAWRVAVGDRIELNQIVADVETAKAVVELPSPYAGVVTALHAEPGETVNVGERLFSCDTGDGADAPAQVAPGQVAPGRVAEPGADAPADGDAVAHAASPDRADTGTTREPTLVGYGAMADQAPHRRRPRRQPESQFASEHAPAAASEPDAPTVQPARAERPRSTPPVRKLAHDLGVDLERLDGTGQRGLITRSDVERAAEASGAAASRVPAAAEASAASASGTAGGSRAPESAGAPGETRVPIRGVRRHTAAAMVRSAFTAPHVTEFLTVDVTATMELLRSLREDRAMSGHRVTPLAMVAKAVCIAAARTPEVNSRWDDEAQEIVQYEGVNLGIAAATERGLVVPNVKRADRMNLLELADAIGVLAETARSGRATPSDLAGGTISITNVGVFGVDAGTPILNPGEAAILAVGAVNRRPWEFGGEIALREVMTLSLSFDHRLVDGQQGSRFLVDVGAILRDPGRALTMC
ncbi:dihydrolipoamide acetyltransferase family protein [Agromyces sp. LHK192]|uniref:dihydrolipoamide acetyltransferase family protein n=1 Tax=Agromyces sp. LHK192 TaxID=2498704 RepID=UPI000FD6DD01|nr:dihydrolipoamide acetyltransferase family protein [Agromyces sp. LHK192]